MYGLHQGHHSGVRISSNFVLNETKEELQTSLKANETYPVPLFKEQPLGLVQHLLVGLLLGDALDEGGRVCVYLHGRVSNNLSRP